MSDEHKDPLLLEHDADGIKELDNNLPRWWVWLFYITIVFGVAYMFHYHVFGTGDSTAERYEKEMARAEANKPESSVDLAAAEMSTDPAVMAKGEAIFKAQCVACHGQKGEGLIGPNMTDEYFIHGSTFGDTIHIIMEGVPAKGMIAWKAVLPESDIQAVGSFIYAMRGQNLPGPRGQEGEKAGEEVEAKPAAEAAPAAEEAAPVAAPAAASAASTEDDMQPLADEASLAKGAEIFAKLCVACHAANGSGLVGPNMTDNYFIHGPKYSDTIRTIVEGVPAKGMISWVTQLNTDEIHQVGSYIYTLSGQNLPGPRGPEGELAE